MKKLKFSLVIFTFIIISIMYISGISAKEGYCEYKDSSNQKIYFLPITYDMDIEDNYLMKKGSFKDLGISSDEKEVYVYNWNPSGNVFKAFEYYRDNNKCPEYSLYVSHNIDFSNKNQILVNKDKEGNIVFGAPTKLLLNNFIILSDEEHLKSLENELSTEYSILEMKLSSFELPSNDNIFECELGEFTLSYDVEGNIKSIQRGTEQNDKRYSSYFHPKSNAECPTSKDARIYVIDGERGYYVGKREETGITIGGETKINSCLELVSDSSKCKSSVRNKLIPFSCVWVEDSSSPENLQGEHGYCNVDNLQYVSCGDARDIPAQVPSIISLLVNLLKIATPIILIFVSVITLVKALAAQKDDEIKKAQSSLVKKLISAVLVFFIISIVQFVVSKVAIDEEENQNFGDCLNCFLNNNCESTKYYKTVINGEEWCTTISTGESEMCYSVYDINHDGKVNTKDMEYLESCITNPDECSANLDLNGDGEITSKDSKLLKLNIK